MFWYSARLTTTHALFILWSRAIFSLFFSHTVRAGAYWHKIDDIYACVFAKQVHYKVSYLFVSVRSSVCLFVFKEKIFVCKFKFSSSFSTFLSKSIEVTVYPVSITLTKKL